MLRHGEPCRLCARVRFNRPAEPNFAVLVEDEQHRPLFATSSADLERRAGPCVPGDEVVYAVSFDMLFSPGACTSRRGSCTRAAPRSSTAGRACTRSSSPASRRTGGLVDIPHDIAVTTTHQTRDELPRMSATASPERVGRRRPEPELQVIGGPSALGGDTRRFVHLATTLAVTEFKLRFFGSALGYLWQLMRPLLLFGVLYVVFTEFVKVGQGRRVLSRRAADGIVLFTFFPEGTGGAVGSVVDREALVRKIQFPRMAIPVSVVLTASFNLGLNLLVVLIFALASGVTPRAELAGGLPLVALLGDLRLRPRDAALGAVRALSRRAPDLGRRARRCCSTRRPVIYTIDALEQVRPASST